MPSYTYRQVMETDYQSLWEGAQKYVEHLAQVQAQIIDVLPEYKSLLPNEFIELKEKKMQVNLLNYIRLCSIYTFADKAFQTLDKLCRDLVDSEKNKTKKALKI